MLEQQSDLCRSRLLGEGCLVISGPGLVDEFLTGPMSSRRLWCVVNRVFLLAWGPQEITLTTIMTVVFAAHLH